MSAFCLYHFSTVPSMSMLLSRSCLLTWSRTDSAMVRVMTVNLPLLRSRRPYSARPEVGEGDLFDVHAVDAIGSAPRCGVHVLAECHVPSEVGVGVVGVLLELGATRNCGSFWGCLLRCPGVLCHSFPCQ